MNRSRCVTAMPSRLTTYWRNPLVDELRNSLLGDAERLGGVDLADALTADHLSNEGLGCCCGCGNLFLRGRLALPDVLNLLPKVTGDGIVEGGRGGDWLLGHGGDQVADPVVRFGESPDVGGADALDLEHPLGRFTRDDDVVVVAWLEGEVINGSC